MKRSLKTSLVSVFLTIFILLLTAGNTFGEEYRTLKGLKSVKAVFDFELGSPQSALVHLKVIDQTFKDKNITTLRNKPDFTVIFIGPSVKLVSKNKSEFNAEDQKILDDYANTLSQMAKEGIKFEICLIAVKILGVDPSTILPEIKQVGNGWISLIGHQAKGYAIVPVSP
jgi:intracellular sulfur oxidation DsrE/DsrF family protein